MRSSRLTRDCDICTRLRRSGPSMQIIRAWDGVPMAAAREHTPALTIPDGFREQAARLLILYAEKHRYGGMLNDNLPANDDIPWHYVARWESFSGTVPRNVPQALADQLAHITQTAVEWFHDPAHVLLGDPTVRIIPDDEVRERIMGMQYAMDKEVMRINGGGQITSIVNPETMEGHDRFLEWYQRDIAKRQIVYDSTQQIRSVLDSGLPQGGVSRYDLTELPFEQQRALVERWERAHLDYLAAHPDIGYDVDAGYLHAPYRIFDRAALMPPSWIAYDPAAGQLGIYSQYIMDYGQDFP